MIFVLSDLDKITEHVRSRSLKQIRSHLQKHLQKLDKQKQAAVATTQDQEQQKQNKKQEQQQPLAQPVQPESLQMQIENVNDTQQKEQTVVERPQEQIFSKDYKQEYNP